MRTALRKNSALAVAAVAALALSLTACNDGNGTQDSGKAADSSPSTTGSGASSADSGSGTSGSGGTGTGTAADTAAKGSARTSTSGAGQNQGAKPTQGTKKAPECKVTSLSYTLKRKNPEQQGDHLLITAVNNSGTACTVQKFPIVTPGQANGDVPLDKKQDQQPPQPLLVPAGGTIYSALPVYQDVRAEDDSFSSIRLSLAMNNVDDSIASVTLKTPGEVEYAAKKDDGITVLSWNSTMPYNF